MRKLIATAAAAGAVTLAAASSAYGVDYTANDFSDNSSAACAVPPAPCNLRGAITAARNNAGLDRIFLLPGTYQLNPGLGVDNGVQSNGSGDLDYADLGPENLGNLEIIGPGAGQTTISATGTNDRVFSAWGGVVEIEGVTFASGNAATAADLLDGGAYLNAAGASTRFEDVVFTNNHANGDGGALGNFGGVTAIQTTFSGNTATGFGGAVAARDSAIQPSTSFLRSTLSGNQAGQGGGAVVTRGGAAPLDPVVNVENSTVAGNRAKGFGGGFDTFDGGTLNLDSVTVTANLANSDNMGDEPGGGLQNAATTRVKNSVIAGNLVGTGSQNLDCSGNYESQGGNLTGPRTLGCNGFESGGDAQTSNPLLGALSSNGGPTQTVPLLAGSPAIDTTASCPLTDQRGVGRVGACDKGAFEFVPPAAAPAKKCKKKKKKGKKRSASTAAKKCKKKRRKRKK